MINWKIKDLFLDRTAVARTLAPYQLKFLGKFGAFTRKDMQSSLRYSKNPSSAGKPPHVHRSEQLRRSKDGKVKTSSALKEFIFFALEESTKTVWTGPIAFGETPGIVPPTLEKGGIVKSRPNPRRRKRVLGGGGEVRLGGGSVTSKKVAEVGMVTYAKLSSPAMVDRANQFNKIIYGPDRIGGGTVRPRPFAAPALQRTIEKIPQIWSQAAA